MTAAFGKLRECVTTGEKGGSPASARSGLLDRTPEFSNSQGPSDGKGQAISESVCGSFGWGKRMTRPHEFAADVTVLRAQLETPRILLEVRANETTASVRHGEDRIAYPCWKPGADGAFMNP
jgi:hypothetical protein